MYNRNDNLSSTEITGEPPVTTLPRRYTHIFPIYIQVSTLPTHTSFPSSTPPPPPPHKLIYLMPSFCELKLFHITIPHPPTQLQALE